MIGIVIISVAAFLVSVLTFFSGFGLATILTPIFMIFFPVELAIALTGVVHFLNNVFKIFLVGGKAHRPTLIRFGIPAVAAAFAGAWVLLHIPDSTPLFTYSLLGKTMEVYPVKFIISILLIIFVGFDTIPSLKRIQFGKEKLPLGGALSGFFGGLSGHQGALRSAFLIKAGLSKEAFIGTAVVVSAFVDFTRLGVYSTRLAGSGLTENWTLMVSATGSAVAGAYLGHRLLKKVTLNSIQLIIAIMLTGVSIALGMGLI